MSTFNLRNVTFFFFFFFFSNSDIIYLFIFFNFLSQSSGHIYVSSCLLGAKTWMSETWMQVQLQHLNIQW